jgi:hypothetical protein
MLVVNNKVGHSWEVAVCCFLGAFLTGSFLLRWWQTWRRRMPRSGMAAIAAGLALAGGLAAWHLPHYAARAEANDRAVLAEILAEPLCLASTAKAEKAP